MYCTRQLINMILMSSKLDRLGITCIYPVLDCLLTSIGNCARGVKNH